MKTVRIIPKETQATKLQNVAAYARVSRDFEPNVHSLSSQVEYYDSLIKKNPLWSFAGVYSDSGLTGTKKNRPGFQSLIEDCTKGKIDIVLTKSISRFARNTVDLLETTRKLRDLRIPVIFEKEQINSMTEDGELMLSLLASFAQEESRSISENIKWGIRRNFEKGIGNNFNRMYGYKYDGQKFVLVDEEAKVVQDIFSSYLNGNGPFAIATTLNEKGYKTANGNPFTYSTIWGMLRCEKYAGCSLFQKTYHVQHCIHVSEEQIVKAFTYTFNKVLQDKTAILEDLDAAEALVFDTTSLKEQQNSLDKEVFNLSQEMDRYTSSAKALTTEDAKNLSSLENKYLSSKAQLDEIEAQLTDLDIRRGKRKVFVEALKDSNDYYKVFRLDDFNRTVDYVQINLDRTARIVFFGGLKIEYSKLSSEPEKEKES